MSYCVKANQKSPLLLQSTAQHCFKGINLEFSKLCKRFIVFNNIIFCGKLLYTMFNFDMKNK